MSEPTQELVTLLRERTPIQPFRRTMIAQSDIDEINAVLAAMEGLPAYPAFRPGKAPVMAKETPKRVPVVFVHEEARLALQAGKIAQCRRLLERIR